jgi:hypothetical protein
MRFSYPVGAAVLFIHASLAWGQLKFTQPTADLGELRGGPAYSHRFEFVNETPQPIEILDVRLGCGCLQPDLSKRTLNKGETATLTLSLRTLGQPDGPRLWRAFVVYRLGEKTYEQGLVLAATLRNEITVEPAILAMSVETTLRQEIVISDKRKTPLKIIAVQATSPALRIDAPATIGGQTKVTIEVSGTALKSARQDETINIYTDDPQYRHLQLPITLTKAARPAVSATPETVEIVGAGSQLVRLRGRGDQAIRIAKVEPSQGGIKCTWAAGPGNDATLKVSSDGSAAEGPVSVRIFFAEPAETAITVPVTLRKEPRTQ